MSELPDPMPTDDSLLRVLRTLRDQGFTGNIQAVGENGEVRCGCGDVIDAGSLLDVSQHRLEGASDPADMMLVVAARCPACEQPGTLVLSYGPNASRSDAAALKRLPQPNEPSQA